ncbi:RNA polymerase sigma factor (sigma-70 family) [Arcicella aurantiaca]|uniref:RNA polymerase sigma factor (Sigma-70 family) n=1 Tax=Arcicella aurantiaca TaxID=591202 RepID=A0A316EDF1_9BACT|nr:sigma-70 family RNA polymerase sigma factor [Arcicella aurantiaca]PWK27673.1 RNA polymerase sigma factor (sigma-70 family) [Arcicella aurantiaca]
MNTEQKYLHLWAKIIKDDKQAFKELFDAFGKELMNYAYKICLDRTMAKSAVQDVFVDIWLYRHNLSNDVQVRFYLYRSVRRAVTRHLKNVNLDAQEFENYLSELIDDASPEAILCKNEFDHQQEQQLASSLKMLSAREREVITLKYYSNLKLKEIAIMLGLKEQTVANTLQNALSKLRTRLSYLVSLLIFLLIK